MIVSMLVFTYIYVTSTSQILSEDAATYIEYVMSAP